MKSGAALGSGDLAGWKMAALKGAAMQLGGYIANIKSSRMSFIFLHAQPDSQYN